MIFGLEQLQAANGTINPVIAQPDVPEQMDGRHADIVTSSLD